MLWELQYGATFFTLEFFFRGYMLFGLRRALGSHAIFVMMVPYCMIHVLKPAPDLAERRVAFRRELQGILHDFDHVAQIARNQFAAREAAARGAGQL